MTELKQCVVVHSRDRLTNSEEAARGGRIVSKFSDPEWACRMLAMLAAIEKDPLLRDTIDGILATLSKQAADVKSRDHLRVVRMEPDQHQGE